MKKIMLIMLLFALGLGSCQDSTLQEVEESACTSCPPLDPPPPGDDD